MDLKDLSNNLNSRVEQLRDLEWALSQELFLAARKLLRIAVMQPGNKNVPLHVVQMFKLASRLGRLSTDSASPDSSTSHIPLETEGLPPSVIEALNRMYGPGQKEPKGEDSAAQ
jgi:hypothetical protein